VPASAKRLLNCGSVQRRRQADVDQVDVVTTQHGVI
jgi:hypothetical protein